MNSNVNAMSAQETFGGAGKIRALLRTIDWSKTPLGAVASWPKSLIGVVQMILDLPTPAIVFWGPDYIQIYNEGYAAIMGPLHPKYFGAPAAVCWPDTFPAIEPIMRKVLAGEVETFNEAYFPVFRSGFAEETYFTLTFSPLRDDISEIAGIYQPIIEVTTSVLTKRRAATLQQLAQVSGANGALAILSSNSKDIPFASVYLWDDKTKRIEVVASSSALSGHDSAALDVAAREAIDTRVCVRIDELGFAPVGPWGAPVASAYAVPLKSTRGAVIFGISPNLHFDELYRQFFANAACTFDAADERAILVARELSARKDAELQKERLAALFMQAPMPVCVLYGADHVITLANPAMCEVWGRPHAEVIERPLFEAVNHLADEPFKTMLHNVLLTGVSHVGKELAAQIIRSPNGEVHEGYFNVVCEPLCDVDGVTIGIIVVAFDVTDEVRAREKIAEVRDSAERENRQKDEFLAMLSHELRNPLAAVVLSVGLMRSRLPTESPVAENVEVIERQTVILQRMVNDLLEVSRITEGKIELHKERIDFVEVVDRALESCREQFDGRSHEVTVVRPTQPAYVVVDPFRIEQVIVNLLVNAAKYTNSGGKIAVTVSQLSDKLGDRVELRVRDNGIGISEDLKPFLFDLFQQGGRDSARTGGGLGLGLTIVRRLVAVHRGTVEARSDGVGRGSEFVVSLPRDERTVVVGTEEKTNHQLTAAAKARKILTVDDNEDAAKLLTEALKMMGHESRMAFDGPSALAIMADWNPDVIFLDIGLPGMDGYEIAREILRRSGRRPTLIALTGYGQKSDRVKTRDAGFDQHLVKPVDLATIASVLAGLTSN